eukprot:5255326-Prymnesium_polylepis.1
MGGDVMVLWCDGRQSGSWPLFSGQCCYCKIRAPGAAWPWVVVSGVARQCGVLVADSVPDVDDRM